MTEYSWDWLPANREEARNWREHQNDYFRMINIAKSKYADLEILKEIVQHNHYQTRRFRGSGIFPAMLENPNVTDEFLLWLDNQSSSWAVQEAHAYWVARYQIGKIQSADVAAAEEFAFPDELIHEKLDEATAAKEILEISPGLGQQFWHDLFEQGLIDLDYQSDSVEGDQFHPWISQVDSLNANESVLNMISPGYFTTWIEKDGYMEYDYVLEVTQDNSEDFFEDMWTDFQEEEQFSEEILGNAAAIGIREGDLEVVNKEAILDYLVTANQEDEMMYEYNITITADTPWEGRRYRDLTTAEQMVLVNNILTTRQHPYLGIHGGLAEHLLICIALHDATDEKVRAYLCLQPIESLPEALAYRGKAIAKR